LPSSKEQLGLPSEAQHDSTFTHGDAQRVNRVGLDHEAGAPHFEHTVGQLYDEGLTGVQLPDR
jgi:hypothetical protein